MCQNYGGIFMYFIGIDISKYKHDCFILSETGQIIRDSFSFDNNKDGFNLFLDVVQSLDCSQEIKIGLESTGHYGDNLKFFLNVNNLEFMEINPFLIKQFIRSLSSRKEKNDKLDAKYIAKFIASDDHEFKSYRIPSYHLKALKSLSRFRESLVRNHSSYLVIITNLLDKMFPEFKDFFNNKLTDTALFILKKYKKPSRIARFTRNDMLYCHNHSRVIPVSKFEDLKKLAKNTIGQEEQYLIDQLSMSIDLLEQVDQQISIIEFHLDSIVEHIDSPIFSIKGIGVYTACAILGEFGNIIDFDTPNQMVAFAGLDCSRNQSGQQDHRGKTVKRGSPHLRYNLPNVIRSVCLYNPVFKTFYDKKRIIEKKPRRVSEIHTAKKLIRVIFALYHSLDENGNYMKFNPENLR